MRIMVWSFSLDTGRKDFWQWRIWTESLRGIYNDNDQS